MPGAACLQPAVPSCCTGPGSQNLASYLFLPSDDTARSSDMPRNFIDRYIDVCISICVYMYIFIYMYIIYIYVYVYVICTYVYELDS